MPQRSCSACSLRDRSTRPQRSPRRQRASVYVQVAGRLRRRHRILYVAAQAIRADDAPMMILRSSAPSPFDRKVRIALSLLGFDRDVRVEAADPDNRQDSLREQNPLGKIPVLIIEDGSTVYDSLVILEYLDDRAGGGKIIPRKTGPRLAALRLQALCDGILDASILTVYEGRAARSTSRSGSSIKRAR